MGDGIDHRFVYGHGDPVLVFFVESRTDTNAVRNALRHLYVLQRAIERHFGDGSLSSHWVDVGTSPRIRTYNSGGAKSTKPLVMNASLAVSEICITSFVNLAASFWTSSPRIFRSLFSQLRTPPSRCPILPCRLSARLPFPITFFASPFRLQ